MLMRHSRGASTRQHELARRAILLAVGDEEVFQRQRARRLALAQHDPAAERDQGRREIADWRTVGDIAADCSARPHLHRAEAAHEFAEIGMDRAE